MNEPNSGLIAQQYEVLGGMDDVVQRDLSLLQPIEKIWQPTDFLPDLCAPNWQELVTSFRQKSHGLGDELLVVLVGDMVTEEALPNYAISLNLLAMDHTGTSDKPWAKWMRGWTGEENRHGDLLNAYLRLTGRVDMRAIEVTVHHLIANGFNPLAYPDPYAGLVYTAFQERATKISHSRVGVLAQKAGESQLSKICAMIAADESRHERFYTNIMAEVFDRDPNRAMLIFRSMMKRVIAMPGKLMDDGCDPDLFDHFASVAQRLDVYTAFDYAGIVKHLVERWKIASRSVCGAAANAQDFLGTLADRLEVYAAHVTERAAKQAPIPFSWIHNRTA